MDDPQFLIWREKIAPLIYDFFSHHNLPWPTQACRFGPVIEDLTYKTRYRVYYSEQTDDSEPQKLIVASADVCKPGVASAEVVSSWTDFSKSPYLKENKVIFHPGEVNKIREIPSHPQIIITHSDAPEVFVWNTERQPNRSRSQMKGKGGADSVADLLLTGHEDEALFPLATTAHGPSVASGGNDCMVLVWDLQDENVRSLLAGDKGGSGGQKAAPSLEARSKLKGHTKAVEEVVFKPHSVTELASVGDDSQLLFWDSRSGNAPVITMGNAHGPGQDVQCVDWSWLADHCVATGAQDGSVKVWDVRHMRSNTDVLANLSCHTDAIIRLEWNPHARGVLASGGDDKVVMLWRIDPDAAPGLGAAAQSAANGGARLRKGVAGDRQRPKELIMQHSGHRRGKVVDFQWCPAVPWALLSVSDDSQDEDVGGGSLQLWRPSELLYADEKKLLEQLEKHREWILNGRNPPPPPAPLLVESTREEQDVAAAAAKAKKAKEAREAMREAAKVASSLKEQEREAEGKPARGRGAAKSGAAKRTASTRDASEGPGSTPATPAEGAPSGKGASAKKTSAAAAAASAAAAAAAAAAATPKEEKPAEAKAEESKQATPEAAQPPAAEEPKPADADTTMQDAQPEAAPESTATADATADAAAEPSPPAEQATAPAEAAQIQEEAQPMQTDAPATEPSAEQPAVAPPEVAPAEAAAEAVAPTEAAAPATAEDDSVVLMDADAPIMSAGDETASQPSQAQAADAALPNQDQDAPSAAVDAAESAAGADPVAAVAAAEPEAVAVAETTIQDTPQADPNSMDVDQGPVA